jgi:hypothetical protein
MTEQSPETAPEAIDPKPSKPKEAPPPPPMWQQVICGLVFFPGWIAVLWFCWQQPVQMISAAALVAWSLVNTFFAARTNLAFAWPVVVIGPIAGGALIYATTGGVLGLIAIFVGLYMAKG